MGKDCISILGFNDKYIKWIGIILLTIAIPNAFYIEYHAKNGIPHWVGYIVTICYTILLWFSVRGFFFYTIKKFKIPDELSKAVVFFTTIVFTLLTVVAIVGNFLESQFIPNCEFGLHMILKNMTITSLIVIGVIGIYFGGYMISRLKDSITEQERLAKENVKSQLETLKNQVNPHFLFNSLNTLASIIPDEPEQAVKYTEMLSKVYRYILEIKDHKVISLAEEMDCINAYDFMLQIRFGNNFKIEQNINEADLNKFVVPLCLQLLVENAIKHNVISTKKPLIISIISGPNNNLIVKNNLQKKEQVMNSTGTGLANITSRYKILVNKTVDVSVTKEAFTVSIPLINIDSYETA